MFGAGSIASMIQSIRNNRNLLKEKSHKSFDREQAGGKFIHRKLRYRQVPPHQTKAFLQKYKDEKEREAIIRIIIWAISVSIASAIFFLIVK